VDVRKCDNLHRFQLEARHLDPALKRIWQISEKQIQVPPDVKILVHIPFFLGRTKRFDHQKHCSGLRRDSPTWEAIRYRLLKETIIAVDKFGVQATIVIDTNDMACKDPIINSVGILKHTQLKVVEHNDLIHGYMLSTVHRKNMLKHLHDYDYFMYAEDDELVPPQAFHYIHTHWNALYNNPSKRYIPTFMRVVADKEGTVRFSDNTAMHSRLMTFSVAEEKYVRPRNSFAAAWVYPREMMQDLVKTKTWSNLQPLQTRLQDGGIRVDMGRGFSKDDNFAVPVDSNGPLISTYVWHLGSSGILHCFSDTGHNTLLPEQFFPPPKKKG